ncbi:MAG: SUF system Fe-S cluster assembly protein [Parvibaculales bacterium]
MTEETKPDLTENTPEEAATANAPVLQEDLSPELQDLTDDIVGALKSVYDPEIPVDIYELGLIYRVEITDDRDVLIDMTLTAPGCPVAEQMPVWVQDAVGAVEGVCDVKVNMVFDPPWEMSRMSDEARVALDMF